ncbi:MAG: Ig-like domain-containing protein, partial [Gemmatimonadales bacterium]
MSPSPASVVVGGTAQLSAVLLDSAGALLSGRPVAWTSTDTMMARVSSSGLVTTRRPGYVTITATSEGKSGSGTVIVTEKITPVARVEIAPDRPTVALGDTVALTAAPRDAQNNVLPGRQVTWGSSDSTVASVSRNGTVMARREGTTTITALVEGRRATVTLAVTPAPVASVAVSPTAIALEVGDTLRANVQARDARGGVLSGRPVTWSSSSPRVATVSADGAVVGVAGGQATITARVEGQAGSAMATVSAVPVALVTVSPATATLVGEGSVQLDVTLRDARNAVLEGRAITWSSSNPATATVSRQGLVTGVAPGTVTVTATSEGKQGGATITVPPKPIVVVPPPPPPPPEGPPPHTPPTVATRLLPSRALATGGSHSCGLTAAGAALCWGSNAAGQLGDPGAVSQRAFPLPAAAGTSFTALVAGADHACGLSADGTALCWGSNSRGQLGGGRVGPGPVATPVPVTGGRSYTALAAGARHTCGVAADGA